MLPRLSKEECGCRVAERRVSAAPDLRMKSVVLREQGRNSWRMR